MQRNIVVRKPKDQKSNDDIQDRSPAELVRLVWPLTESAWAFKEAAESHLNDRPNAQSRLSRHLVSIRKRGG